MEKKMVLPSGNWSDFTMEAMAHVQMTYLFEI